jgi:hypothetical protein
MICCSIYYLAAIHFSMLLPQGQAQVVCGLSDPVEKSRRRQLVHAVWFGDGDPCQAPR